ncbi:TonB-dependent receptor [Marinifilum sp.]|uniref:TonB-dependent receptor n=1 Tax=Marinifilum sp. TaxID=2033137 RepID=UPI003BA952DA
MKNLQRLFFVLALALLTNVAYAQSSITGTVVDAETNAVLPGANVVIKGTTVGTTTDIDGKFEISVESATGQLVISFIGFEPVVISFNSNTNDLGEISLKSDSKHLQDVVVIGSGLIDFAKDRQTPVAVSTISSKLIQEKLGNQEFPEILRSTPSIYVTKQGGGYGDSRINVRGFDQRNTAVMINGQPINDMENGWVYWSNWAGMQDVASGVQVQRGLGSSKLAISSVGGTINIVTKATQKEEGGFVKSSFGNDGYQKYTATYSTGVNEKGWGMSMLLSHWEGDGYNDGTRGQGQSYFLSVGYKPSEKHEFNFMVFGAPQWHDQNYTNKLSVLLEHGKKYNDEWGYYQGGYETMRRNFYHKPVMNFNWDWNISEKSALNTVAYVSFGRGGGTGPRGNYDLAPSSSNGEQWDFDAIRSYNSSRSWDGSATNGYFDGRAVVTRRDGMIKRASMNSHNWIGLLSNFNHKFSDKVDLDFGIDLRNYRGMHYRTVVDLFGADAYFTSRNANTIGEFISQENEASPYFWDNKMSDDRKLNYHNDGLVRYVGTFAQIEYKSDSFSSFFQGAVSNQSARRIEFMNELVGGDDYKTDWNDFWGGNLKAGANYNFNENHNIFANAGFYSRQPNFDATYINYGNTFNDIAENEQIVGFELGYGYRSRWFDANVNLYSTTWDNRWISKGVTINEMDYTANFKDVKEVHNGIEIDFVARPLYKLRIDGQLSIGDWYYDGNVEADLYDDDQNQVEISGGSTLFLDDVKVGDAAQLTASIGAQYELTKGLKIDARYNYADKLYAELNVLDFADSNNKGALELPSYSLVDLGASYNHAFKNGKRLSFRVNVNNLLDEEYISESDTNIHAESGDETWEGIDVDNKVYFGFGTTWNASVTFHF